MTAASELFPASGPGMQRGGRFVYVAAVTKTIAAEYPAPAGMVLDGFEIRPCGGGAGGTAAEGGGGGQSPFFYISLAEMGSPATVAITIGAGGAPNVDGGDTSFGLWAIGRGGRRARARTSLTGLPEGSPGYPQAFEERYHGRGSPSGSSAGGGGGISDALLGVGGAVRPLSSAAPLASAFSPSLAIAGDNPSQVAGGAGHPGVGDHPGGGGNASLTVGGSGGFPGGGGGAAPGTPGSGAAGRCIIYPWFKKA